MIAVTLVDLAATEAVAGLLAPHFVAGDVVELHGDIGAGKTTFTGAVARALGSFEPARSPTYTVAHRYDLPGGRHIAHLDCYRETGELDVSAWGDLEPYFEGGIALVEWPEPIRPWLRDRRTWRLELDAPSLEARVLRIQPPGDVDVPALVARLAQR